MITQHTVTGNRNTLQILAEALSTLAYSQHLTEKARDDEHPEELAAGRRGSLRGRLEALQRNLAGKLQYLRTPATT
jgi:hypothetical protein